MNAGAGRPAGWQFQDVRIDLSDRRVTVGGEVRDLEPKSFRLLAFLVENRGRALSKDEILDSVWNGMSVSDNALTRGIAQVRKAIGDDSRQPRYIETVPTVGYRFIAEVEPLSEVDGPIPVVSQAPVAAADAPPPKKASRFTHKNVLLLTGLGITVLLGWFGFRYRERALLGEAVTRVENLAAEGNYVEAYATATEALAAHPSNPRLLPFMSEITDVLTVHSTPEGADVFLQRLGSPGAERIGSTPLESKAVARGEYVLFVRKKGYADFARTVSTRIARVLPTNRTPWKLSFETRLIPDGEVPSGTVRVDATEHKLTAYSRPVDAKVSLVPFFLDRHEVTNREFKQFLDAGGYNTPRYWKQPGLVSSLKDKTGINGPRDWVGGAPPQDKADHPVTGVTWHEAYAYCQFRGKTLPTLFEWEETARGAMLSPFGVVYPWGLFEGKEIAVRANLSGSGTTPVGAFPLGMSPYGAYDMAGNVSEWLLNPYDTGYTTAGGGWSDPVYAFGLYQSRPELYQDASLGFRCSMTLGKVPQSPQAAMPFSQKPFRLDYPASTPAQFEAARKHYQYADAPLNARIVAEEEKDAWKRQEIEFDGFGGKRAKAFLYLPRNSTEPYQVIHYLGGAASWYGVPVTDFVEDRGASMAPFIRSGRAVLLVVLEGFHGREPVGGYVDIYGSLKQKEILVEWVTDMRRAMDYLASRKDIDGSKVAFWNTSTVEVGIVFAALEKRLAAIVLNGVGVAPALTQVPAEANALHFAPHIREPKLVLTGLYDEMDARQTSNADPVFNLLVEPKKLVSYIGGHVPPNELAVPVVNAFLDEKLGKTIKR